MERPIVKCEGCGEEHESWFRLCAYCRAKNKYTPLLEACKELKEVEESATWSQWTVKRGRIIAKIITEYKKLTEKMSTD